MSQPPPSRARAATAPRPWVSLLGALCVIAGSAAIAPMVAGTRWLAPTVQVVGLIWLVGVGCRMLRLAAPIVVLAQAAAVALTLTAIFTNSGFGGVLPNAAALREAGQLLAGAWEQILSNAAPAPGTPELSFLIALSLGMIALIVDFFVAEVETPALVALPMLCLYSVPASIDEFLLPWWAFAIPAGSYAILVVVAGRRGRSVGWRAGFGVAAAAIVTIAVSITASLVIADSFTNVGTAGRIERSGDSAAGGNIGLSPFASLHGDLQRGEVRDVLAISGLPGPDYLRTTALEQWSPTQGFSLLDPSGDSRSVGSPIQLEPLARNPEAQPALIQVQVLNFADRFVPVYQGTTAINGLGAGYQYNSALGSVFRPESVAPNNYELAVAYGQIRPDLLRADTVTPRDGLTSSDGVPQLAVDEARRITAEGATPFDKAVLLKDYFTAGNGFVYSLQVPTGNSGDLLTDFLTHKQGYCEQYAAAMAIMLRSIDIPARVAIGFTQGHATGPNSFTITSHDAHAWVEVRFDNHGWVRFDPTPLSDAIGGQQGFQTSTAESAADPSATNSAATSAGGAATNPSAAATATFTDFETVFVGADGASAADQRFWQPWYTWALVVLGALAVVAALPSAVRRTRAKRRLALAAAGGPDSPGAAWAEIEDLAADHGLPNYSGATIRRAANSLARDAKLSDGSREGLRRIVLGAESAWYSPDGYSLEAGNSPPTGTNLAEDVRRIAVDMEHSAPRTLTARVVPRSVLNRD